MMDIYAIHDDITRPRPETLGNHRARGAIHCSLSVRILPRIRLRTMAIESYPTVRMMCEARSGQLLRGGGAKVPVSRGMSPVVTGP